MFVEWKVFPERLSEVGLCAKFLKKSVETREIERNGKGYEIKRERKG